MAFYQKDLLSKNDLINLAAIIAAMERSTSGEIRVAIRKRREWNEKKLSIADLALKEFNRLGMHKTRDKTGVLIFLLLSEKIFHITADESINKCMEGNAWKKIARDMSLEFSEGHFYGGLADAVRAVGGYLKKYFPRRSDDANELPNDILQ